MAVSRFGRLISFIAVAFVVLILVVVSLVDPIILYPAAMYVWGVLDEADQHELNVVIEAMTNTHRFAHKSISDPLMDPVFGHAGRKEC
jgi:hypothetical protein